ncbi:immunoglobulin-like domain-containing protein [Enterococcus hirae]|uniref:immunoglobulin-like domain-containing protein n=1 Tax=Enterococcus hirae TaxID=1354 RepID=UPI0015C9071A|nr:immunoglobulin-like domain-containing protein [Enterococcus hirae]
MNYKKSLFITLLSVSVLGATTTTHVFAEQNDKTGVSAPAKPTEKAGASVTTPTAGKATTPAKQNVSITLSDYVVGRSLYITGTYNNTNAVYVRAEVNGQKKTLVSSKELASGKVNYYVGNLKATDKAEIILFNKDYQEIGRQQVKITEPVKTQINLEPYVIGRSLNITGNYNGTNAVYMRAEVNGQKKGLVSSKGLTSGKISYYVGNLKATDKADIVLFDKNYQEIGRQQVTFTEPAKTVVTLDKYVVGKSSTISGTYNGTNAVYMQAEVNGKKEAFIQSKGLATGKISYYVGKLNTGDQAEIILFDKNYQEIGRQKVAIDGPAQVLMKLDNYTIGRSTNITGTYNGTDAKYIQAEVNGKKEALVQPKELANGKITYYVGNLKAGSKVAIILYNKDYQEIGRQQVTLVEPVPIKFTLDNYVLGDSNSITGTYDGTNAVYMQAVVNGEAKDLQTSKELETGKINYNLSGLKQTDNVQLVLYNKGHQEIGRQAVSFSVNQVFYISGTTPKGSSSDARLLISTENQHMTVSDNAAIAAGSAIKMNGNFGHNKYFTLTVTGPNGESIYNNIWYGDTWVGTSAVVKSFNVPNGSTVVMYHAEASGRFNTNDNGALKNKAGKTYTYKMENNRLVLVNVA